MSGTYYIDYSSSVLARTAQLLLTCSAALNVLSCSQRRRGWYESFFITEHRLVNINQPKEGIVRTNRTKTMSTWSWQKSPKHKMLGHWLTKNQPGKLPCRWLFWSGATFILRWSCWSEHYTVTVRRCSQKENGNASWLFSDFQIINDNQW